MYLTVCLILPVYPKIEISLEDAVMEEHSAWNSLLWSQYTWSAPDCLWLQLVIVEGSLSAVGSLKRVNRYDLPAVCWDSIK